MSAICLSSDPAISWGTFFHSRMPMNTSIASDTTVAPVTTPRIEASGYSGAPGMGGAPETPECTRRALAGYRITAADVASGGVTNVATAVGTDPDGGKVETPEESTHTPTTTPAPALEVEKAAGTPVDVNGSGLTDKGDTIVYTFTVTNTGNVPLTGVTISDARLGLTGPTSLACGTGPLAVGATRVCPTATYTVFPGGARGARDRWERNSGRLLRIQEP